MVIATSSPLLAAILILILIDTCHYYRYYYSKRLYSYDRCMLEYRNVFCLMNGIHPALLFDSVTYSPVSMASIWPKLEGHFCGSKSSEPSSCRFSVASGFFATHKFLFMRRPAHQSGIRTLPFFRARDAWLR